MLQSAQKQATGIEALIQTIENSLLVQGTQDSVFSARQRHIDALAEAHNALSESLLAVRSITMPQSYWPKI
jgi:tRNA U34 5-carboxymethylaminomethyl modifying GTPase MnmE/TrmE